MIRMLWAAAVLAVGICCLVGACLPLFRFAWLDFFRRPPFAERQRIFFNNVKCGRGYKLVTYCIYT